MIKPKFHFSSSLFFRVHNAQSAQARNYFEIKQYLFPSTIPELSSQVKSTCNNRYQHSSSIQKAPILNYGINQ
jgi:hypothetical protein